MCNITLKVGPRIYYCTNESENHSSHAFLIREDDVIAINTALQNTDKPSTTAGSDFQYMLSQQIREK